MSNYTGTLRALHPQHDAIKAILKKRGASDSVASDYAIGLELLALRGVYTPMELLYTSNSKINVTKFNVQTYTDLNANRSASNQIGLTSKSKNSKSFQSRNIQP